MADYYAIILAGGQGKRCQQSHPKQYSLIGQHPMLYYSTMPFIALSQCKHTLIVTAPDDLYYTQQAWPWKNNTSVTHCPRGGIERHDSLYSAVLFYQSFCNKNDWIIIHDAARPLITTRDITVFIDHMHHEPVGGILAIPVCDTLKKISVNMTIDHDCDRSQYWRAQTPQMFRFDYLVTALQQNPDHQRYTDTSGLIESYLREIQSQHTIRIYPGPHNNLKVTYPEDLAYAQWSLTQREAL